MSTLSTYDDFYEESKLRDLSEIIDNILLTVANMVNDFHFNTRYGDFMMEQFDNYLYEIKDHASYEDISCEFKDYELTDNYIEWIALSKINEDERLKRAIQLLRNVLFSVSYSLDLHQENNKKLTSKMCENLLLLHAIMGTLDLHYNTIDGIIDVLSDRQIKLLEK